MGWENLPPRKWKILRFMVFWLHGRKKWKEKKFAKADVIMRFEGLEKGLIYFEIGKNLDD